MTNLQKIREACIKANPEIVALPAWPDDSDARKALLELEKILKTKHINDDDRQFAGMVIENYQNDKRAAYVRELEGKYPARRPIRLSDVLLAIHAKDPANKTRITLESDGQFIQRLYNSSFAEPWLRSYWNLRSDDLVEQSPETIDFIASLLE